jgi:hypothetical protein
MNHLFIDKSGNKYYIAVTIVYGLATLLLSSPRTPSCVVQQQVLPSSLYNTNQTDITS